MPRVNDRLTIPDEALSFRTSRSGGPGGQHVNRTETRVEVSFDVREADCLNDWQRQRLLDKLSTRISQEGVLTVAAQDSRSQLRNKELAVSRLVALIDQALTVQKPRRATKPSQGAKKRRLESKKRRSNVKKMRGRVDR